jgi:hypothetical protein
MAAPAYPPAPLYNPPHPRSFQASDFSPVAGNISLISAPPATDVANADRTFDARAAAAIAYAAAQPLDPTDNGQGYQDTLLAKWAYFDYFNVDPSYRMAAAASIGTHTPALEGTDYGLSGTTFGGDNDQYDFTLNYYIPLVYRYYQSLSDAGVADYIINTLIGQASRSGLPTGRPAVGSVSSTWSEYIHLPGVVDVPESENHLLGILAANYLGNQLVYQRTQNLANDNGRNGDPENGAPNTTDLLLGVLQGLLDNDFQEYNARPYQDESMSALLNLASYAYDDRVRLAARMVLDYVSAKIAVSSDDLRRAPPYRRRNELQHYGPTIDGNFLGTPFAVKFGAIPSDGHDQYDHDPQIAYYSSLTGNTDIFFWPAIASTGLSVGSLPADYDWEMVHAGVADYRIPPSILDLFLTRANRHFYQYFHHGSGHGEFADELYAGSPSYLISAGGRATTYANRATVSVAVQALFDALAVYTGNTAEALLEPLVLDALNGSSADLGSAVPTFFLPANQGLGLSELIQFGEYTTDESESHLCVAPDFACGGAVYIPPAIANDPSNVSSGHWTFVNRAGGTTQPGYYLAIYTIETLDGGQAGLLEAYDTWRPSPLTFDQFVANVQSANAGLMLQYGNDQANSYTTQSGQSLTFSISPHSQILSTTALSPAPASNTQFTAGTILNSAQGSGLVTISNRGLGKSITLDMQDLNNISRTAEDGTVEYGGEEVWVNFNYGSNQGDFAQPYTSLQAATQALAGPRPAKVFKIISGTDHEAITINQPVVLTAVGGPVVISGL